MYKAVKILFSVTGIVIFILIIMIIFNMCPPEGPWPEPPWCSVHDTNSRFEYSELTYIPKTGIKLENNFIFGIGMMDLWGKLCTTPFTCDNPKEDVDSSFTRLKQINTDLVMITDFYQIDKDKNILEVTQGGARTISQKEIELLINKAHKNRMKFMLITNLYDKDNSREALNLRNPTKKYIDKLFNEWKEKVLIQAKKGIYDYFIVNPRDIGFFFESEEDNDYINNKFLELIPEIRKIYQGKVCLWGFKDTIGGFSGSYDCLIIDQEISDIFKGMPEDLDLITKKWDAYLSSINYNKTTFVLILMPSYDGAKDNGWIEPVGVKYKTKYIKDYKEQALIYEGFFRAVANHPDIEGIISYGYWWNDKMYPNTLDIFRNDLSHSIRNKDAESVFYRWSNVSIP